MNRSSHGTTAATQILETPRLRLRQFATSDAGFILHLLNDPAWLRYIGDRGVRTLAGATDYIENTLHDLYRRFGFGLYCIERKEDGVSLGMCGLVKRDGLDDVDLGFALLPECCGHGYAFEAAAAVIDWAHCTHGISRLVAITSQDNRRAEILLTRLGFRFECNTRVSDDEVLRVFAFSYGRTEVVGGIDPPR